MLRVLTIAIICGIWGCSGSNTATPADNETVSNCPAVTELIDDIERFETLLESEPVAPSEVAERIGTIKAGLRKSLAPSDPNCTYLNAYHEGHQHFEFVTMIADWSIRDTIGAALDHLIDLRGIFSDDSAIAEFHSEEIARIALRNPFAFRHYFETHPKRHSLLLNGTTWSYTELNELLYNFSKEAPQAAIYDFLVQLRPISAP